MSTHVFRKRHKALILPALVWAAAASARAEPQFNYAEALQKSLYFYEAQQSGPLSPNNRVAWRGPACLNDGQDIGRDLSGGWFDAGDHWTANLTMAFATTTLAWSAIEQPEGYLKSGQMDELLENLVYVNQYFLKCVLNPDCHDPARNLEVAIGCGGLKGVPAPNVHAMWAPAEVAHLMTNRPTFRLNKDVPGGDIPAAMAASMAATAMVVRRHAAVLKGKPGYEDFDASAFADRLLENAEKLVVFAHANSGPIIRSEMPEEERERIRRRRRLALRSDGAVVETGYRADPFDKVFTAAALLQRAHLARDPSCGTRWFDLAEETYDGPYTAEFNRDFWKDFGAGNFGKLGAYAMMRLAPHEEKYHHELQLYCVNFCNYKQTPGGLRLREWFAHEYGSLRHANNAAVIALYYSEFIEQSPPLEGNAWWKKNKPNDVWGDEFQRAAVRQVDYALGDNPYGRSYLVGFGQRPFNHPHHRGAYGAWAGFWHFIPGKAEYRETGRHILYGALLAGPDHNDVFLCGDKRRPWLPLPDGKNHDFFYRFPDRSEPVQKEGYRFDPADQPVQDVMDSKFNEVALDYNAGFTASLAWLTAHGLSDGSALPEAEFPPPVRRDENTDLLTTDREFFVAARQVEAREGELTIEATLFNRSRWPARATDRLSFRYYFQPDGSDRTEDVQATVAGARGESTCAVEEDAAGRHHIEVRFDGQTLFPGDRDKQTDRRTVVLRIQAPTWNDANDWSHRDLDTQTRLLPRIPVFDGPTKVGGQEPESP